MTLARSSTLAIAFAAVAALGLTGCTMATGPYAGGIPGDLPADPEPCASYCKVWVPPVTRQVPYLVQVHEPGVECVPETVREMRYREVCVDPGGSEWKSTPDLARCEKAVVQTKPGGWLWRQDGDCWKWCYEPPCYTWCDKTVTEEGIAYCAERSPTYRVEATSVPVERMRTVYTPGQYEVRYRCEVYKPGHWEWQPHKDCGDCEAPAPCPDVRGPAQPCRGPVLVEGCPPCN
jgi:hypothetical protein